MRDNHTDGETPDQERRPSVVWADNGPCVTADEDGIVTLYKLNIVASWQFRLPGLWDAPAPKFEVTPPDPCRRHGAHSGLDILTTKLIGRPPT